MAKLKSLEVEGTTSLNNIEISDKTNILEMIYPIGAVYISTVFANPQDLFGFGEWEFLPDRFLLGAGDTFQIGATGGSTTHSHDAGSLYACIGSPYGNATALGFTSLGWHGANSTYSVGGTSSAASGHPSRSHDTDVGGDTGSSSSMPPYLVVYMWKRIA